MLSRLQLWLGLQPGCEGLFRPTRTHSAAIAGLRRSRSRLGGRGSGGSGASWLRDRKQSRIPPPFLLWSGLLQASILRAWILRTPLLLTLKPTGVDAPQLCGRCISHPRFPLPEPALGRDCSREEIRTAQNSVNTDGGFSGRVRFADKLARPVLYEACRDTTGGPTEMPPGLMGFPAGMISRAAFIFGVSLGLQPPRAIPFAESVMSPQRSVSHWRPLLLKLSP